MSNVCIEKCGLTVDSEGMSGHCGVLLISTEEEFSLGVVYDEFLRDDLHFPVAYTLDNFF